MEVYHCFLVSSFVCLSVIVTGILTEDSSVLYDPVTHKGLIILNATTKGRPIQPEASFNITCRAIAKLSWYLNNAVLDLLEPHTSYYFDVIEEDLTDVIHNHTKTDHLAYQSTLLVNQASKAHEGTYQCVVYATDNVTGKTDKFVEEISITLAEILVFPGPNFIPSPNADFPPYVTLTCRVQSNVPVDITWAFHHEYLINNTEHHLIHHEGPWTNLTIIKPSKDDLGRYACLARRIDETDLMHPFASLGFVYFGNASNFHDDDLDNYDEDTNGVDYYVKNMVEMAFDVDNTPSTGVPSMTCSKYTPFNITKHNPNFPKEVRIECTPPAGYVLHNEAIPAWFFKNSASADVQSANLAVELESRLSDDAKKAAHRFTRVYAENGSFALVTRGAQLTDVGLYMVKVTFAKADSPTVPGPTQTFADMKMEAAPLIEPYFELSYAVDVGDSISLTCSNHSGEIFSPTVLIWLKDDSVLVPDGDRVKILPNDAHINGTLSFSSTVYEDRGYYNCSMSNDAGNRSTKTLLRVQNPNRFVGPMVAMFVCLILTGVLVYAEQWWRKKHPLEPHDSSVSVTEEATTLLSKKRAHEPSLPHSIVIPMVAQGQEVYPIYVVDAAIKWRTFAEKKKAIRNGTPIPVPSWKGK